MTITGTEQKVYLLAKAPCCGVLDHIPAKYCRVLILSDLFLFIPLPSLFRYCCDGWSITFPTHIREGHRLHWGGSVRCLRCHNCSGYFLGIPAARFHSLARTGEATMINTFRLVVATPTSCPCFKSSWFLKLSPFFE